MQGVILSTGRAQGLILGDDGVRYTFTPLGWRASSVSPEVGMRVDFEACGSHAEGIYPISDAASTQSVMPVVPPDQPTDTPPQKPSAPPKPGVLLTQAAPASPTVPDIPPAKRRFAMAWWHWALVGGAAFVIVGIVVAVVLGIFGSSGPPPGREIARHTHEGRIYTLVEYGDELAIFSNSGAPVGQRGLAEGILRSYAWRQVVGDFDIEELTDVSAKVRRLDDSVSGVRDFSNDVVVMLDDLDGMKANVPFVGSISAMDVVRDSFPGVGGAEDGIRSLDSELNALRENTASLASASQRIRGVELSSVSGDEMEALFTEASEAVEDLEDSVRTVKDFVSDVRESVARLASALQAGSNTPIIGDALGNFARSTDRFESELSGLFSLLGGFESQIETLAEDMRDALESTDKTLRADMGRWLAEPYDSEWPSAYSERRAAGVVPAPAPVPTAAPLSAPGQTPFKLEWETSSTDVEEGKSFTLSVRMYEVQEAGEHGGITVSFPSLTQAIGSIERHSSSVADVEALDYTSGLSNVTFHQPGATIYHRENIRQFSAEYLLVESDDASWSRSDDRTLQLRITPKRGGEFPIQIRGWLCTDEYTDCSRSPDVGDVTDQQGWLVEVVSATVGNQFETEQPDSSDGYSSVVADLGEHTCALKLDGQVVCWGNNDYDHTSAPAGNFIEICNGYNHTCALHSDGKAVCWGRNHYGQASPPDGNFTDTSAGADCTCGLNTNGTVVCWGRCDHEFVTPPDGRFVKISMGGGMVVFCVMVAKRSAGAITGRAALHHPPVVSQK